MAATRVASCSPPESKESEDADSHERPLENLETAFSLERFLPLLEERVNVMNPFTRTFLVAWITLLDSIPDLELVAYLPRFLGGLFKFLSDPNQDVHTATQVCLDRFLNEVKKIARVKRGIAESRKSAGDEGVNKSNSSIHSGADESEVNSSAPDHHDEDEEKDDASVVSGSTAANDEKSTSDGDWIPGQDVQVEHSKIMHILVSFLSDPHGTISSTRLFPETNSKQQKKRSNSPLCGG
jgi:vacuole morphology and inheritance protein 14